MVLALGIILFIDILAAAKAYENKHYKVASYCMFAAGVAFSVFVYLIFQTL